MEPGIYIVLAIIVLLIIIVISNIKIVPQAFVKHLKSVLLSAII